MWLDYFSHFWLLSQPSNATVHERFPNFNSIATVLPLCLICLIFILFSAKKMPNNRLTHPWGVGITPSKSWIRHWIYMALRVYISHYFRGMPLLLGANLPIYTWLQTDSHFIHCNKSVPFMSRLKIFPAYLQFFTHGTRESFDYDCFFSSPYIHASLHDFPLLFLSSLFVEINGGSSSTDPSIVIPASIHSLDLGSGALPGKSSFLRKMTTGIITMDAATITPPPR